jgi:Immunity protein 8
VRAELKSLDSSVALDDLRDFRPNNPESLAIEVAATVGPPGVEGGDLFYFSACTAQWLQTDQPEKGFAFLHGYLLLTRWDFNVLERAIGDLCFRTEGSDWDEVATKLSRYGRWEFEDYREAQ